MTLRETLRRRSRASGSPSVWTHSPEPATSAVGDTRCSTWPRCAIGMDVSVAHPPGYELDGRVRHARGGRARRRAGLRVRRQVSRTRRRSRARTSCTRARGSRSRLRQPDAHREPTLAHSRLEGRPSKLLEPRQRRAADARHADPTQHRGLRRGPRRPARCPSSTTQAENRLHSQKALLFTC